MNGDVTSLRCAVNMDMGLHMFSTSLSAVTHGQDGPQEVGGAHVRRCNRKRRPEC